MSLKKNKKAGIVLKFILATLVALIIFIPTILFASELFRVSDQATDNFQSFVKELKKFTSDTKNRITFLSILDEGTAVFLFKDKETLLAYTKLDIDNDQISATIYTNNYNLPYPETNCAGKLPCACLCKKFDENKLVKTGAVTETLTINYNIVCEKLTCEYLSEVPLENSFSIYRGVEDQRRSTIIFERKGDQIFVKKQ